MARFTQEQIDQATAEFFGESGSDYLECSFIPGAGNNGPITTYKLPEVPNGAIEAASE
jgi:hypothetical protein